MHSRSLQSSRAEILFAELLLENSAPSEERVRELCAAHPELASELVRLHEQLAAMRGVLSTAARPAPEEDSARRATTPPDLGAFRCVRLLGRGGMGEVWEAEDRTLGRAVAIKLLRDGWSTDEIGAQRFQREAQAASRVPHRSIVAVHQTGEWEGRRYIVQELVPGGRTLRDEIEELRRLDELPADHARRVAERFETLAGALAAAHAAGIVHRDVKPQNVLLTPSGEPKLADFGLALLVDDASLTRTSTFLGTYFYASPEQIEGEGRAVDERSDVFSLGATLYENLTLVRAFDGDSTREVARAVTLADPVPPHVLRKRIPRDLSILCMKALEKRPHDRYASMAELHEDLRRFLAHEPVRARPPTLARRAWKWSMRHPTIATALVLSLASTAALLALYLRSERAREQAQLAEAETSRVNTSLVETSESLRRQSAIAEDVIRFLVGMFEQTNPEVYGERAPTVRELVDRTVARIESGEIDDPAVRSRLMGTLGLVVDGLGDAPTAKRLLEESLRLRAAHGADFDPTQVELGLAGVLSDLAEFPAAYALLDELDARALADEEVAARYGAMIHLYRSWALSAQGRFAEAEQAADRAAAVFAKDPFDDELDRRIRLAQASYAYIQGRVDEARPAFEELIAECSEREAGSPAVLMQVVSALAMMHAQEGRLEEAEAMMLDLCEDAAEHLYPEHPTALFFATNLARVWEQMGRYEEAEAQYRELADLNERVMGPNDIAVLTNRNNVATCLMRLERYEEAEAIFRDVWQRDRDKLGATHHATMRVQHNLAQALAQLGRVDEALALQEAVVAHTPPDDPNLPGRRTQLEELRARAAER